MFEFRLDEYKSLLADLISFETTEGNKIQFKRITNYLENYCQTNDLKLSVYEHFLTIEVSNAEPEVVFFTHVDIVPTTGQDWDTNPYQLEEKSGKYYGRGVIDDKGPLAAILLLLKNTKNVLDYNVRLFVGFHEETTFKCIKSYNKTYRPPKLGIVSDAKFPVVYGEKGSAYFKLRLARKVGCSTTTNASNTVIDSYYGNQKKYSGIACHSSKACIHNNPLYKFLVDIYPEIFNQVLDFKPNKLGVTIYNPTQIFELESEIEVYFDVRFTTEGDLELLENLYDVQVEITKPAKYEYYKQKVDMLMNVYQEVTGDTQSPARTSTAGTYSSYLGNTYVFGFASPGEEGNVHIENEYIKIDTIKQGYKVYEELLYRLKKEVD